jgi:hypothetical protein
LSASYANQLVLAPSPLSLTTSYFFQLNPWGHSPYVTSFLTRGWACRLQLLLVLASAVILGSESRSTHDHILLSQIRVPRNLEGQVPVFTFSWKRVAQLYSQALGSLLLRSYSLQRKSYLPCRCIEIGDFSGSVILAFKRQLTIPFTK